MPLVSRLHDALLQSFLLCVYFQVVESKADEDGDENLMLSKSRNAQRRFRIVVEKPNKSPLQVRHTNRVGHQCFPGCSLQLGREHVPFAVHLGALLLLSPRLLPPHSCFVGAVAGAVFVIEPMAAARAEKRLRSGHR